MTFAAVGSQIHQGTSTTFSLTPNGVGNAIFIEVAHESSSTVVATALSSTNVTWSTFGSSFLGTTNNASAQVFQGTVTSTSTATVTITFSGTPGTYETSGQEFTSTVGSWALDVQGHIDSAGITTWASLTPAAAHELYFGYAINAGTATGGSTPGYTYDVPATGNGMAFNPNCTAAAQAPVWGDSGQQFGIMVLVKETPAVSVTGGTSVLNPPGRLSPPTLGFQARPVQAPQTPPSGQATPVEARTPPGRLSPVSLGLGLAAPSPAPQTPPSGQATPPPLAPPGRLSPASLGLGLTAPSPAPQVPVQASSTGWPLTPPGFQSPMALGVPLAAPSPAPQTPVQASSTPYPLVPPGLQSPAALTAYLPPGSPAPAPPPPPPATVPGSIPPTAPGLLTPATIRLYAPSPAPQTPPPPPPPAAVPGTAQLTPPGLGSPMALGVPLYAPSPAPQAPVQGQATQSPQPQPPGLQSPASIGTPLTAPSPAPQTPVQGQATPSVTVVPPGRLSPMAFPYALAPGSPQPGPPPPVVTVPSAGPQLVAPGLLTPATIRLYAPSPAPQTPSAVVVATPTGPGTAQLTPPGRLSPMSLAVPIGTAPGTPAPGPLPPTPPIPSGVGAAGQQATSGGDRDVAIRVVRPILPGDITAAPRDLQRPEGRGYAAPWPHRAEDVPHAWEATPEPAPEPGPSPADKLRAELERTKANALEIGAIFALEPYRAHPKKHCGATRRIGGIALSCKRKPGHYPGSKHSDRGLDWG